MSDALLVRTVAPADFDAWSALWDGYQAFYGRHGPSALSEHITHITWQRFLDANEPVHCLVADRAGELVGLAHYIFHRSTIHIESICYLQDLYTSAAARRQGVGRALIEAVYERARATRCARVYWLTHHTNHQAMQLYDKIAVQSGFLIYRKAL